MTKREIFTEIVERLRYDSSTCKDKGVGNYQKYLEKIKEEMSDKEFVILVRRYLASFRVGGHLFFWKDGLFDEPLFGVRRYKDVLYVDKVYGDCKIKLGEKIVCVDGMTIPAAAKYYDEFLCDNIPERQDWNQIIDFSNTITLESGEELIIPRVKNLPKPQPYIAKEISDDIFYISLEDFNDSETLSQFIKQNHNNLCNFRFLIIDVRVNHGGSDINYYPLISYCFPKGETFVNPNESYGAEVNYTEHNVERRIALFEVFLKQDISVEMRALLEYMCTHFAQMRGAGFVRETDSGDNELPVGEEGPERIVILTDSKCGSAGDLFVENFKSSDKVFVIGRPTAGIIDYANEAKEDFGEFHFMYPTSRRCAIDHGIALTGKGVSVDIYVSWSPQMIFDDLDIKKAIEFFRQEE